MQTIGNGYQAFSVLWAVNFERFLFPAALLACLSLSAHIGMLGFFWH